VVKSVDGSLSSFGNTFLILKGSIIQFFELKWMTCLS
jgi:hypothetical protein